MCHVDVAHNMYPISAVDQKYLTNLYKFCIDW